MGRGNNGLVGEANEQRLPRWSARLHSIQSTTVLIVHVYTKFEA